jgi:hypothetical protein
MPIQKVDSSMIWAVDYSPETQVLEIAFRRTGIYRYTGVPPEIYEAMMQAPSIGNYVRSAIIGSYPESRLD